MRLYNTLSRAVEEFKPGNDEVKIYTCGPTLYDYPHIGNWFTFIRYDILIRTLAASDYKPKWVLNMTDVGHLTSDQDEGEDKLALEAKRENKTAWDIAGFYGDYFIRTLDKLNFTSPWQLPRATDHINDQIEFIKRLEAKGYTYQITDGVYFDTAKFPHYSDFARLDLDEQQAGGRVSVNPEKHHPPDFALWKLSPKEVKRDMEWDSPWGRGFPGWHIECSAMILKYLGETIDIHCGGIDHVPIHHTNEIAQSEALTGHKLARLWLHTNHILLNDQKISKSLGNTLTLEDLEAKGYNAETLRLLVLESHYRSQSKFDWANLEAAAQRLLRYRNFAARRFQAGSAKLYPPDILSALQDDLNTPKALLTLELYLDQAEKVDLDATSIEETINQADKLFGLRLGQTPDISPEQKRLIAERESARQAKDWSKSDAIRSKLNEMNITLLDQTDGTLWQYAN